MMLEITRRRTERKDVPAEHPATLAVPVPDDQLACRRKRGGSYFGHVHALVRSKAHRHLWLSEVEERWHDAPSAALYEDPAVAAVSAVVVVSVAVVVAPPPVVVVVVVVVGIVDSGGAAEGVITYREARGVLPNS